MVMTADNTATSKPLMKSLLSSVNSVEFILLVFIWFLNS
jgi:hypothetical protein